MHASAICKKIDSSGLVRGYCIFGEELYWHEKIVQLLVKHYPGGIERLEGEETNWNQIAQQVAQGSFFGAQLLVVSNGQHLFEDNPVSCPALPDNGNCLVLSVPVKGKKNLIPSSFVKEWEACGGLVIDASPLPGYEIGKRISALFGEAGYRIKPQAVQTLIMVSGRDMARLEKEIQKIMLYHGKDFDRSITDSEVLACVSPDPETNMFGIEDAVGTRNMKKLFQEYDELHSKGISHFLIISVLASYIGFMWRVKVAMKDKKTPESIGKSLGGIHPFRVKKAMQQSTKWSWADLEAALRLLCVTDYILKKGEADTGSSMGRLLIGLCGYGQD